MGAKIKHDDVKVKAARWIRKSVMQSGSGSVKVIRSFCIPPESGGTRTMEVVLIGSRQIQYDKQEILVARHCNSSKLSSQFKWVAAKHNPQKLMAWMNYQIFQLLQRRQPS